MKVKKFDYVNHTKFGPLYVLFSFRDSGGTVFSGINGRDGIQYQFYASECDRKLTSEEIDYMIENQGK